MSKNQSEAKGAHNVQHQHPPTHANRYPARKHPTCRRLADADARRRRVRARGRPDASTGSHDRSREVLSSPSQRLDTSLPYLPEGTEAREVADWIANEVDEGKSVTEVAAEAGLSRSTIRRAIACIELADDLYDGGLSEMYEEGVDAIYLSALQDPTNAQFEAVDEDKA